MDIHSGKNIRIVRAQKPAPMSTVSEVKRISGMGLDVSLLMNSLPQSIDLSTTIGHRSLPTEFSNRRIEQSAIAFLKNNIKNMERNDKHGIDKSEYSMVLPFVFPVDMGNGLLLPFGVRFMIFVERDSSPFKLESLRWEAFTKGKMSQLGDVRQYWGEGPYLQQGSMPQADKFIEEFLRQLIETKGHLAIPTKKI